MLDYIDEILNTFDKANPTGDGTKSSSEPDIIFEIKKTVKN